MVVTDRFHCITPLVWSLESFCHFARHDLLAIHFSNTFFMSVTKLEKVVKQLYIYIWHHSKFAIHEVSFYHRLKVVLLQLLSIHDGAVGMRVSCSYGTGKSNFLIWLKYAEFGIVINHCTTGPLFTKRTDVLPQDLVKSRSREIRV